MLTLKPGKKQALSGLSENTAWFLSCLLCIMVNYFIFFILTFTAGFQLHWFNWLKSRFLKTELDIKSMLSQCQSRILTLSKDANAQMYVFTCVLTLKLLRYEWKQRFIAAGVCVSESLQSSVCVPADVTAWHLSCRFSLCVLHERNME